VNLRKTQIEPAYSAGLRVSARPPSPMVEPWGRA
jgi:hypothetical protein